MKKFISMLLVIIMIAGCMSVTNVFASDISVTINGEKQTYDVMPVIENGRTLVPMRGIFEALGAEIAWEDATKTVTGTKGDVSVVLTIGNTDAKVNGKDVILDVPAKILEGRTMVPVRFISESLGCEVGWEDSTKTVIINMSEENVSKYNMAKLISTVHRPVPTEFEKSNDLNDNYFFGSPTIEENEELYAQIKSQGEVVCTTDEFAGGLGNVRGGNYGSYSVVNVSGQKFKKAIKIKCHTLPEKTADFIIRTTATPERNPGDGVNSKDVMLLAFRFRCTSGGDANGNGTVQIQIEHPETYKKALFQTATAGREWQVVYMPFTGVANATSIGIRPGFFVQEIELGGIEIINMGQGYPMDKFPNTVEYPKSFDENAQWRKDAIDRIEKIRKGDFSVIVKDKDGNIIPDAEVEFDMFEHEFQFGSSFNGRISDTPDYKEHFGILFNAGVAEHQMKWAPYENNPAVAIKQIEDAKNAGVKYVRGHTLVWERDFASDGKTYLTPKDLFENEKYKDKAYLLKRYEEHVKKIIADFPGMADWDVVNEIIKNKMFRDVHGNELLVEYFKQAREAAGEDCDLYYNETSHKVDADRVEMYKYLDLFEQLGVDYDGIGIQSHYDSFGDCDIDKIIALYDALKKYNKRMKVTEFSCSIADNKLQANMLRDTMILTFSEEQMDGFLMWGFWDGSNFAAYSPIYDSNWNLKYGGKVFQDLVYNKWWTKDAKATTDKEGKATVNGFYGDYDVTVKVGDKVKTEMVAFHKGYDNILEIVVE